MSRKKIAAANWKMNLGFAEASQLIEEMLTACPTNSISKIICTPFPYLQMCAQKIASRNDFMIGAQDCSTHAKGAYTGETSASMIASCGARYVIIGHSERRTYHQETNEQLSAKIEQAFSANLNVIYCVGEILSQRKAGQHKEVVIHQLEHVLRTLDKAHLSNLVLAYEPVWAIGTGETASPEQAQEMHAVIRQHMHLMFGEAGQNVSILYGGSCNAKNAKELFACNDVDGGLIGGASLIASDFSTITSAFE